LKDNGQMLLQAITIADQRYEPAKREVDFIKKYIFPGGFLPSVAAMGDALARVTDMRIFHLEDIGPHYALTLQHWRERFLQQLEQVYAQGFDKTFARMWEFYLCYCEGAFLEHAIGTVQMLMTKSGCRRQSLLGSVDNDISGELNHETAKGKVVALVTAADRRACMGQ
jgi:cyclopropane-fatty-acyl-phospholipid synthase